MTTSPILRAPFAPRLERPGRPGQEIAVIGAGVSGLVSAWLLSAQHRVTVFEARDRMGGHTHTVPVRAGEKTIPVDTGFIVFNEPNYPLFTRLLERLGVAWDESDMSFSVSSNRSGIEYCGSSLSTLFAQRRNLFRPRIYAMLKEILRFNKHAPRDLREASDRVTLGAYLQRERYGRAFVDDYIVPMAAALWSAEPNKVLEFPARYFVEFFDNHAFLQIGGRPPWRVVRGGSHTYVRALTRSFADRIRTGTPVRGVRRVEDGVRIETDEGGTEAFDAVVLAVHSDQALRMLRDPSPDEERVLGAIPYQANPTRLHTDASVMPRARRAWASWNYHVPRAPREAAAVTYHMNRLQNLRTQDDYFVSLNRSDEIDDGRVLKEMVYHHPIYTPAARQAQRSHQMINGVRNTWYCGAYWGHGFHEDGVRSAARVCARFGLEI